MDQANNIVHIENLAPEHSHVQAQAARRHTRASFLLARTGGK
jgi:hypothetical protein